MNVEVIKIGADWCEPCNVMQPSIDALMKKYNVEGSNVSVTAIDIAANPEFVKKYEIRSIPTTLFMSDGNVLLKKVGVYTAEELEKTIEQITNASNE